MFRYFSFWVLIFASLLSWGAWGIVINNISPNESPEIAFPAFYITLFIAFVTTYSLFGALIRKAFRPGVSAHFCLSTAIRQGFILAFLSIIAIAFQHISLFSWLQALLLLLMAFFIEAFFWERDMGKKNI